jgi:hypothetical protein
MDPNVVSVDTVADTIRPGMGIPRPSRRSELRLANRPKLMIPAATRGKVSTLTV